MLEEINRWVRDVLPERCPVCKKLSHISQSRTGRLIIEANDTCIKTHQDMSDMEEVEISTGEAEWGKYA